MRKNLNNSILVPNFSHSFISIKYCNVLAWLFQLARIRFTIKFAQLPWGKLRKWISLTYTNTTFQNAYRHLHEMKVKQNKMKVNIQLMQV